MVTFEVDSISAEIDKAATIFRRTKEKLTKSLEGFAAASLDDIDDGSRDQTSNICEQSSIILDGT